MNDFKEANPEFRPLSAVIGEGDGAAGYYHVRYKKPNDERTYEQIWLYLDKGDGVFRLTSKGKETIVE